MLTQEDIKNIKDCLSDSLEKSLAASLKESLTASLTESLKDTFVTKEYFDEKFLNLMQNMDNRFESFESRFDSKLAAQTDILIGYTHQSFEAQQEYLDERFNELIVDYNVRDRVEKLEKGFYQHKLNKPYRV